MALIDLGNYGDGIKGFVLEQNTYLTAGNRYGMYGTNSSIDSDAATSAGAKVFSVVANANSNTLTLNTAYHVNGNQHTLSPASGDNYGDYSSVNGYMIGSFNENGAPIGAVNVFFRGDASEFAVYNNQLGTDARHLVDQYQAAKWGIALTPPGTGATEVAKATASDGYSVFTTRYLEHLSQSADISLQAGNNITLDLKGDTLAMASDRNLTLTAGNDIASASNGTITTAGAGNISLVAGNDILFNDAVSINAMGTGDVSLQADRHVGFFSGGGITTNGGAITLNSDRDSMGGGAIALNNGGSLASNGGAITLGGGADPTTGFATGTAGTFGAPDFVSSSRGVLLSNTNIGSAGGLITINGEAVDSSNPGILVYLTAVSSGASAIKLRTYSTDINLFLGGVTIASTAAGTAITLASGRNFINGVGSGALSTPSGRWLVYSTNPANDTLGELTNDFRRFSCNYGGSCPIFPATGNGFLYRYTPTLTVTPNALAVTHGAAAPNLSGYGYALSGYLGSDAGSDAVTGTLTGSTNYVQRSNVGSYNLNYSSGTLSSILGYGFSYANLVGGLTVNALSPTILPPTVVTSGIQPASLNETAQPGSPGGANELITYASPNWDDYAWWYGIMPPASGADERERMHLPK